MATALVTISQGNNTLVAAQPGKIIRLSRLVGSSGTYLTVKSGTTDILPPLKSGTAATLDLTFDPGDVMTARGEALTAESQSMSDTYLFLVYDITD